MFRFATEFNPAIAPRDTGRWQLDITWPRFWDPLRTHGADQVSWRNIITGNLDLEIVVTIPTSLGRPRWTETPAGGEASVQRRTDVSELHWRGDSVPTGDLEFAFACE